MLLPVTGCAKDSTLLSGKSLTTLFVVVVVVAETVPDTNGTSAVLYHVHGDLVVIDACRFGVDTGELPTAVQGPIDWKNRAGAGAAIPTIISWE